MTVVNPYFLATLLEPMAGLADDDEAVLRFSSLNPNDEAAVRKVIRELIVPHTATLNARSMERVRIAYRYYLSKPDSDLGRVFDSVLPPFDPPNEPRSFFVWIWEECFPDEPYLVDDLSGFIVRPDIDETWQTHLD